LISSLRMIICGAALIATVGCGSSESTGRPELGRVQGIVTLDGAPLPNARVMYFPADGRGSSATTDASGAYALDYTDSVAGAKVGQHTVQITTARMDDDTQERVPSIYNVKSTLAVEVKSGNNEFNFNLTSK